MRARIGVGLIVLGFIGGIGCGNNPCEDAAERVVEKARGCGVMTGSPGSSECDETMETVNVCIATCFEGRTCEEISADPNGVLAGCTFGCV